ncbi:hypothetical protein ACP4OV_024699 [Aristida adscensionis]
MDGDQTDKIMCSNPNSYIMFVYIASHQAFPHAAAIAPGSLSNLQVCSPLFRSTSLNHKRKAIQDLLRPALSYGASALPPSSMMTNDGVTTVITSSTHIALSVGATIDPPSPSSTEIAVVTISITIHGAPSYQHVQTIHFHTPPMPTSAASPSSAMGGAGERGPSDGNEPSTSRRRPIMSAPPPDPPPKKRKLVEAQLPGPSSSSSSAQAPAPPSCPAPAPPEAPPVAPPKTLDAAASSAPPPPSQTPSGSQAEALQKLRNREELVKLFNCHRRIREFLDKGKHTLSEVEQDYLYLISSSREGSESAQRFLSLLIPRFSRYCPTALEAAAKVTINMYKRNMAAVTRAEDMSDLAYQTARTCILGLTDICAAASSEAPKSSVITGICSAVYMTILTFFISSFDGKGIYHIGSRNLSVLQNPERLLETLKLESGDVNLKLKTGNVNQPAVDCLFELRAICLLCIFLLFPENMLEANFSMIASAETDDAKLDVMYFLNQVTCHLNSDALDDKTDGQGSGMEGNLSDNKKIVDSEPSSDNDVVSRNSAVQSNECYITLAISRHPSLRRWILSRYKKICDSCKPAVVSEVTSCLEVLGSLSELVEDESHMGNGSSVPEKLDKNVSENMQPDELIASSDKGKLSQTETTDIYGENFSQNKNDMVRTDNQKLVKLADAKTDGRKGERVISDAGHQCMRPDSLTPKSIYDSAGGSTILTSPGQHFGKAKHLYSEPFDLYGASVSRDVILVSKELWVGSLGNRATEALVRSKFEVFGPLANFLFHPSKGFSLVEYRNITHAVRASGYMQASSIWGGFLQIRYLDRLVGSKGSIGGVAVGESCHIYVAKINNQKDKDELFDELKAAGLKRPCGVTDLSSENALLLEFETAVDAAIAKACLRHHAHANAFLKDKNTHGHQLLVQNLDISVPDSEFINAFSRFGEVIRWQFNRSDGSCFIVYRSHDAAAYAKSHLHGARFGSKSISVESRICSSGPVHDKTSSVAPIGQNVPDNSLHHEFRNLKVSGYHAGYAAPGDRPIYGPSPPNTQVWHYTEIESNRAPQGIIPCPPVSTHRGAIIPPPPIQTSFVRPVYPGPGSPWENTTPNPPFSHVSPRMMPGSNFRVNPSAPLPFMPSSITPLMQLPAGSSQHSDKMLPPPRPPNVAPQPFTPLDMPRPTPPPLPISQPPSVPPPPNSPPHQPIADLSNPQKSSSHPRWQGSLSKSGLHYCKIYASRVELDACRYENAVSEPAEWPLKLDVTKRTDFLHVKTTFSNTPPNKREVCRLLPCSNGDQKGYRDFISYLKQRECAGVIKIPSAKPMWSRLLFILPPTSNACGMLDLPPHPAECLVALVVPKETTVEAA